MRSASPQPQTAAPPGPCCATRGRSTSDACGRHRRSADSGRFDAARRQASCATTCCPLATRQLQAEQHPELLFVNEVYIKESPPSCFAINEPNVTRGGVLVKRCGLSFEELCRYKYLLNVGSNGYANKLKYLFLTGSVVIWVKRDSLNYEFFEHQFVPGVHYVSVEAVEEVPDRIRRLQADPAYAKAIAVAGQERMAQMDTDEVAHYCYQMLRSYAAIQRFTPRLRGGILLRSIEIH